MSPRNLWRTLGDEMKIASNSRAKVVGGIERPLLPFFLQVIIRTVPTGLMMRAESLSPVLIIKPVARSGWTRSTTSICQSVISRKMEHTHPENTYVESTEDENEYEDGIRKGMKATLPLNLPAFIKNMVTALSAKLLSAIR